MTTRRVLAALGAAAILSAVAAPAVAAPGDEIPDAAAPPAPLRVAVVAPLVLPPGAEGLISADDLETFTGVRGVLTRQLDELAGSSAAIAIDPRIVASVRVLGSSAPESARAWLSRLALVPNETFLLGYADVDVVVASQAGTPTVPGPTSFVHAIDPANFAPVDAAAPTPTPGQGDEPDAGDGSQLPPLPASPADLLAWDADVRGLAWPTDASVTAADLPVLQEAGYRTLLLDAANASPGAAAHSSLGDGLDAVVADTTLSRLLRGVSGAFSATEASAALAGFAAGLAATAGEDADRVAVVTLDRTWPIPGELRTREAIDSLAATPGVEPATLSSVMAAPSTPATIVDAPESAERRSLTASALETERLDAEFARVAVEPALVTGPRRLDLLALLSATWFSGSADWPAAVQEFRDAGAQLRSSVQLAASSDLLALGNEARIPITVTNALDVPVRVLASADPTRSILTIEPGAQPVEIVVQPDSSTTGYIATQAVANGQVPVRMSLTTGDGTPVGDVRVVRLDLQAGWETAGVVVAGAIVVLVFGAGIVRTVLRRRRARAEAAAGGDAPGGTAA